MSSESSTEKRYADEIWRWYLTGELTDAAGQMLKRIRWQRRAFGLLPGQPRCLNCNAPLSGSGASVVSLLGVQPSSFSPLLCNQCEVIARKYQGGAEVELSLLFADVRGSTPMAAARGVTDFSQLIGRFYSTASEVLIRHHALINRLMGDQVIGLFVPRLAGPDHTLQAIEAGRELLLATGHGGSEGPWVPVGVGIHAGLAYVGAVGAQKSVTEIAVLGEAANMAARLASQAAAGEILLSQAVSPIAEQHNGPGERRNLTLKGLEAPQSVTVIKVG
jgi:adenylate cyclase